MLCSKHNIRYDAGRHAFLLQNDIFNTQGRPRKLWSTSSSSDSRWQDLQATYRCVLYGQFWLLLHEFVFLLASLKLKQNDASESYSCCRPIDQTVYLETDGCSGFIGEETAYDVCKTQTDTGPNKDSIHTSTLVLER